MLEVFFRITRGAMIERGSPRVLKILCFAVLHSFSWLTFDEAFVVG